MPSSGSRRGCQAEGTERDSQEVQRLRAKLADAELTAREQRARLKEQLDVVKAENTLLRRKLGDARAAERAATEATDQARAEAVAAASAVQASAASSDTEVRRLRARVAELEALATAVRRDTRVERDDASLRARMLLDTLLESAQGLRRELGLPTVTGAPADRLESELSVAEPGVRTTSAAGMLGPSSPALLENYLAMPRARLIVDGYNVSKAAWPESSLEVQRMRLLNGIAPLVARSGAETTVVFDAATERDPSPGQPATGCEGDLQRVRSDRRRRDPRSGRRRAAGPRRGGRDQRPGDRRRRTAGRVPESSTPTP